MQEQTNQTNQELLQAYKDALAKHDWYYQYSDDPSVYRKGLRTQEDICIASTKCIRAGLEKEAEEVYQQFWNVKLKAKRY